MAIMAPAIPDPILCREARHGSSIGGPMRVGAGVMPMVPRVLYVACASIIMKRWM
jgi:hypothetical protein